ncbi:MAG TPA: O-antigen ligase family protein, partial [Ktedonobacterales bacterium]|nr:O-antigen ligase family protein [Ktedonobacterales bacterium]
AAPLVIIGLEANNRRADYLALLVGGVVAWLLTIAVRPQARTRLIVSLTLCLVMGGAYVLVFSHVGGALGRPAQAIVSAISPDATDVRNVDSNQYRTIENFDLQFTESQSPLLGYGFGKPFLQHTALPNIVGLDPIYLLVPHNNIYWIWMRLGPLGYLALWYLIGVITVRGCLIVRELRDNFLQQFAIFVIAATFMEVLLAYADYQLFFFRNVIFLGLTVGMLFKLPAIDKATDAATAVSAVTPSENQLVAARQA